MPRYPILLCLLPFAMSTLATAQEASPPKISLSPVVRVALQLDSASTARFNAHGFDLRVAQNAAAAAEIELVKVAGPSTGDLVRLSAAAAHAPSATIEVLDSLGRPAVTLRLTDIAVVSDHLSLSAARATARRTSSVASISSSSARSCSPVSLAARVRSTKRSFFTSANCRLTAPSPADAR